MTITLIDAKNPVWSNAEQTSITLECKFSHYAAMGMTENDGYYPFTADKNDQELHGKRIYENAVNGDYGTIGAYTGD